MSGPTGKYHMRAPSPVVRAMLSSRSHLLSSDPKPNPNLPTLPLPPVFAGDVGGGGSDNYKRKVVGPTEPANRRRRGSGCGPTSSVLPLLGGLVSCSSAKEFTTHVLTFEAGEDIASKLLKFAHESRRAMCILSVCGPVSKATLLQSGFSDRSVTHEGYYEILRLSGSYLLVDDGALSVMLACSDGQVIGGAVGGPLIAASPVLAFAGTFLYEGTKPKKEVVMSQESSAESEITTCAASDGLVNQNVLLCTNTGQYDWTQMDIKPCIDLST